MTFIEAFVFSSTSSVKYARPAANKQKESIKSTRKIQVDYWIRNELKLINADKMVIISSGLRDDLLVPVRGSGLIPRGTSCDHSLLAPAKLTLPLQKSATDCPLIWALTPPFPFLAFPNQYSFKGDNPMCVIYIIIKNHRVTYQGTEKGNKLRWQWRSSWVSIEEASFNSK